jgi:hypothetical protein
MIELKAFYPIICSKSVVTNLFGLMLQEIKPETHASRNNALFVLNSLCKWMQEKHKSSNEPTNQINMSQDEDDDLTLQDNNVDEEEQEYQTTLISALVENLSKMADHLEKAVPQNQIAATF